MVKDEFWLDQVRRLGGNQTVNAFADLEDLIASGRLGPRELRSVAGAMRSLSQKASDAAAEAEERKKFPWRYR
jgi:hypothetical protein